MSEANDKKLANALPEIIWTCDTEGRLEWVNDRWVELTGMSVAETLADKGGLLAVHPDDRAALQQRFGQALATGESCEVEYRIRTRAGVYRWHLCRVVPLRDDAGAISGWVAAAFDIEERKAAEEGRLASERRFATVFHLNPQPTAITRSRDGTYLDVNQAFLDLTGFTREEIIGRNALELGILTEEQRAAVVRASMERNVEIPWRTKNGRDLVLAVNVAHTELDGEDCLVGVSTDVTDRKAADAALRHSEAQARAWADDLTALMDAVPAAVWIAEDPQCRTIRGNRAGREILRMNEGENVSKTAGDPSATLHFGVFAGGEEIAPEDLPIQRAARGIEVRNWDEEVRFSDGNVVHMYGNAVPLRDPNGALRGAIGAFVDVTRLKRAEAALRDADRRKDEFLALLSHELRNPLAPIVTAARLLQMRDANGQDSVEREVILRQADHLVRLVDDLLDVSKVARGKVTLTKKPLELAGVVANALEETGPLLEQRRHRIKIAVPEDGLVIDGDDLRLTQVVTNLLTNALRYTPPGGAIEVTAAREGDEAVLRVRDNGVGIDATLLPHVFDMFIQGAQGPDRAEGGLGLGLSLVRSLTGLHGGTVTAHSDGRGRGSEFAVRLPLATNGRTVLTAPSESQLRPGRGAARHRRVLVVDDNSDGAFMIGNLLEVAGYEVEIANDPSEALLLAERFRPEMAILDIGLPVMDGYRLGRELRARLTVAPILIALTGYGREEDKRRSEEAHFAMHLVKPVDPDYLLHTLDLILGNVKVS